MIFLDYLTKWVEAFAVQDQSATTIAKLLVEEIFCRHGAPEHLLSDRVANLSTLIQDVCNYKKVNTSGYHPQTDDLVERLNSTLINMLSKCAEKNMVKIGTSSSLMCYLPTEQQFRNPQGNPHSIYSMGVIHVFHPITLFLCLQPHTWLIYKTIGQN